VCQPLVEHTFFKTVQQKFMEYTCFSRNCKHSNVPSGSLESLPILGHIVESTTIAIFFSNRPSQFIDLYSKKLSFLPLQCDEKTLYYFYAAINACFWNLSNSFHVNYFMLCMKNFQWNLEISFYKLKGKKKDISPPWIICRSLFRKSIFV
jgi:hypothetical protein